MFNEARRAAWVEISTGNIASNFNAIRRLAPKAETLACIKADAYGHGIVKTAWVFVRENVDYLGVATLDEAVKLRSAGIKSKIVLLYPVPRPNIKDAIDLRLILTVTSIDDAKLISEAVIRSEAKSATQIFIELETGMGRLGFLPSQESIRCISEIESLPGVEMLGVLSHFASADDPDLSFARKQLDSFNSFISGLREAGLDTGRLTMANSAAIMALPESHFDIIRPGIALYGLYPSETMDKSTLPLSPVMTVKANIIYIKKVPSGFPVSYGSRFTTERDSLIASLPIGYGDGMPRAASGKARVLVRGGYAPIVGTICMDVCMVDVTDIPGVCEYDEVVVLGEQGGKSIAAAEIAENSHTSVYEVVCRFGQRLPAKYL